MLRYILFFYKTEKIMSKISIPIVQPLFLIVSIILLLGCTPQAAEEPTSDPVVVNSEQENGAAPQTEPEIEGEESASEIPSYPAPEAEQEMEAQRALVTEADSAAADDGYPAPSAADSGQGANIGSVVVVQTEPESNATDPNRDLADADVIFVSASQTGDERWSFSVTVAHPDTGWEDYADGWDVVLPDGTVAKASESDPFTRLLLHPHETEQPFTRSQSNIPIPADIETVTVRAHDIVHGWGGAEIVVNLTQGEGEGYEVR